MIATLRPASPSDLPAILEIYAEAVVNSVASFELEPPSLEEMTNRFATITGGGYPYIVAEINGGLAGYAYASSYRPRKAYRFTVENSLYVHRNHRRKGLATLLMRALIEACEADGYRQMMAVISDVHHGSPETHEKLGFIRVGMLENIGFKFNAWHPTLLMQRPLGQGSSTPPVDA